MAVEPKEWVSEAAQTSFRDSETQHLVWDSTTEPPRHPFTFPRGRGLHYPVIFDPAWPVHIAAPKRLTPPVAPLKENFAIGTYALKGMTLGETERKPIKKTLVFPHRNTDLPFRHPTLKAVKERGREPYETLTLEDVEGLEPRVVFKSILERIPQHDLRDKREHQAVLRQVLRLGPACVEDPGPPAPLRRKPKRHPSPAKHVASESA
ncbi:uncharacterized protein [Physcomitrium patens]|uniref:uncharacterized protein n=1 Tax=Physcomitrium patens TaxID=3218 RepID=UPI00024AE517|nr:uncharacterized protein LOC112277258 [Physcomitrium patens]XP_024365154.1 uncharacterized protein LOC112277258 [Physcomitrium patens]|eukprot:XP_024365153.1 uncharacterized protein LOC112277258 [Physcomitrella patens]